MRVVTSNEFFRGAPPAGLPGNSPDPEFDRLPARAAELDASPFPPELKAILLRENRALGSPPDRLDRLDSAERPLFVIAGQQAGLFGGPLYTLYKAMHAIRLAQRLTESLARPVFPLFWVASDDHDFAEVNHLGVRSDDGSLPAVSCIPAAWREGMPVGDILLDRSVSDALQTFAGHVSRGEAGERYRALLEACWRPGERWGNAFARQLSGLLAPFGLLLIDPRWPGVKALFAPLVRAELDGPLESTAAVNETAGARASARLRSEAIRRPADATNLFLETGGIRRSLRFDGELFSDGESRFRREEILDLAGSAPDRFSPGAALRPVFQDRTIPVLATIVGPGERTYFAQIEPVYRLFGVSRSIPWPRASFTVIDRRILRYAEQEGATPEMLFGDAGQVLARIAGANLPPALEQEIAALEQAIAAGFDRLAAGTSEIDRTLADSANRDRGRMLHILEDTRARILRASRATHETAERRIRAAASFLLPGGRPQERWYGADAILPVLDEAGWDTFIAATSPEEHRHRIVLPE